MKLTLLKLIVFGLALAAATPAMAQVPVGDPASGRRFAQSLCSACHALTPADARPSNAGPGFKAIADLPSTTTLALTVFLRTSHNDMPNLLLSRNQEEDLVAFILSLKSK